MKERITDLEHQVAQLTKLLAIQTPSRKPTKEGRYDFKETDLSIITNKCQNRDSLKFLVSRNFDVTRELTVAQRIGNTIQYSDNLTDTERNYLASLSAIPGVKCVFLHSSEVMIGKAGPLEWEDMIPKIIDGIASLFKNKNAMAA